MPAQIGENRYRVSRTAIALHHRREQHFVCKSKGLAAITLIPHRKYSSSGKDCCVSSVIFGDAKRSHLLHCLSYFVRQALVRPRSQSSTARFWRSLLRGLRRLPSGCRFRKMSECPL